MASVLGIDLAWHAGNNTSAVSIAEISGRSIHIERVSSSINNWRDIISLTLTQNNLIGIAIDAPLIVRNRSGQRSCESELGREYGSRGASCHSTNLKLYPNSDGVNLSKELKHIGFEHLNHKGKFQIECYPHPAIIEIFGLQYRLLYKIKNRSVNVSKTGQCELAGLIKALERSSVFRLTLSEETQELLNAEHIFSLSRTALKENEDALDSIICAYIAGLFNIDPDPRPFGSISEGYIYVPRVRCI